MIFPVTVKNAKGEVTRKYTQQETEAHFWRDFTRDSKVSQRAYNNSPVYLQAWIDRKEAEDSGFRVRSAPKAEKQPTEIKCAICGAPTLTMRPRTAILCDKRECTMERQRIKSREWRAKKREAKNGR